MLQNTIAYIRYRPGRNIGFLMAVSMPHKSTAIASGSLIGFLLGPALIGFISEKLTLATGLSLVLVLSLPAVWAAYKNTYLGYAAAPLTNT